MFEQYEKSLYNFVVHMIKKGEIETARKAWETNRKETYCTFEEVLKGENYE